MAPILAAIGTVGTFLAANAGTISTVATIGSTVAAAGGAVIGGQQAAAAANAQAKSMERKGDQELAIAQRKAIEDRHQKNAAVGRAQAVAAASGGGTGDTVTDIMTGIEARGQYNVLTDMYNGQVARHDLYSEAKATRQGGANAKTAGYIEAGGAVLKGAGTIYSDYGARKRATTAYNYDYQGG